MKTKRIDQYICIDTDQVIIDDMNDLINTGSLQTEDREFWDKVVEAAKVILDAYTV